MVLVSGGTGFVGRQLIRELTSRGHRVRVLSRHIPKDAEEFTHKQVEFFTADVTAPDSLMGACEGVQAVIHLVGRLGETWEETFEKIHVQATTHLLREAKRAGVKRWIQMSSMGTRAHAASRYHQTKWQAEELVRGSGMDWTIFRPSIIFGRRDRFTNLFAAMLQKPWTCWTAGAMGVFGDGESILQFIAVEDVAHCLASALSHPLALNQTLELCGESCSFSQMLEKIAAALGLKLTRLDQKYHDLSIFWVPGYLLTGRRPLLFSIPLSVGYTIAGAFELSWGIMRALFPAGFKKRLGGPPFTMDMLTMLQEDQRGDCLRAQQLFNFTPRSFSNEIQHYLQKIK